MASSSGNIQSQAIALIFAFPALATIVVVLRIYIRVWTQTFALDDWVICFAGILYWAETITSYYVIKNLYIGYHVWDIPKTRNTALANKYAYATELIYNPILAVIKTSILLFLLRLTGQKIAVRRAIWGLLILNGVAMVATFLLTTFHCIPIASNWDAASYPNARCINFANFVTGTACVSIFTDVLVLILPTWIVYNLRIAQKQKLMLIGILSFGLITVISGIVRVVLLDRYDRHPPADYTYSVLFCISTIEVGLAFVAACAPSLKPLAAKLLPKVFSNRSRSGPQYSRGEGTSGRLGYNMDALSRSRRTQNEGNLTLVEAGEDERQYNIGRSDKPGIMMTTEMEVKWHGSDSTNHPVNDGSSTESLVQPRR
ncbi:hypothetical protein P175DRAFT_0556239 [Aspergillus ochraceoroseus IBT 24754]|uniref:Rhodopsin domain-containing protein n=2 Tax=Aspergillus ochraceoroseus TaxID=138278 RepID=A0A2T5M4X5_9EURO|nr:uncharacterized protein P175DRAFT_0556239 [Aspergillus ochraceoroseus IBT 24754]KKK22283.1 hypothetical protein AOCH_000171 [Aspergillus ochraceoroseus]PTU23598.1 hypothetical protein P175DRAFT_0556239 [Aspergillus ochraceoroseus IBT 24754]